ncbi:hypothetical protein GCM10010317_087760 [Streptomyces mirabilis]|uniref:hypothetical protein n=1 Tax=Streptomyces mirabilis TaxID=68239 RepID=UPI00199A69D2|nr:hypothetical protein [Streptomyces mirabilis]GHD74513.1 hypothetical protein GCM10010317_087760 [Streptomyces mirabilis]
MGRGGRGSRRCRRGRVRGGDRVRPGEPGEGKVIHEGGTGLVSVGMKLDHDANGIVATPDGRGLIAVSSSPGRLYNVDLKTGYATEIALIGATV